MENEGSEEALVLSNYQLILMLNSSAKFYHNSKSKEWLYGMDQLLL